MKKITSAFSYTFFGTSLFAVHFLESIARTNGDLPTLIVTNPDRESGRKLALTPPPVKLWAEKKAIPILQPEKLDSALGQTLRQISPDFFLVVSYGKILPKEIFDIPPRKTLNLHPSLLPRYRGPSPIESQILADDRELGVTLIQIDEQMDHGPIIAQKKISPVEWPVDRLSLEKYLAEAGAALFNNTLTQWLSGTLALRAQDEAAATVTKKVKKADGEIDLRANPRETFLKIMAYAGWPRAYFVIKKNSRPLRITVTKASFTDGKLSIEKVIPEGRKEVSWQEFERNYI